VDFPYSKVDCSYSQNSEKTLNLEIMKKILFTFIFASLSGLCLEGGTITSAGTLTNLTPPGNGSGDVADLDAIDTGQDGFVVFNTLPAGDNESGVAWDNNIIDSAPAYVTALDGSAAVSSGGWANYDGVILDGTTYNTGGLNQPSAGGTESPLFSFELTGSVPTTFTLGLLTDNSDNVAWAASNIRVEGPGAVSANQDISPDGGSDLVKFDIGGGTAGETYTVYGTSGGSGPLIGVVTFDSEIPDLTDPTDSDNDNMGDDWEIFYFGDLDTSDGTVDGDNDGATDLQEWTALADPTVPDSDGDGLNDGAEINTHNSSPTSNDSDSDGLPDGYEVTNGLDPASDVGDDGATGDPDGDTLDNTAEIALGTDPNAKDTDTDGYDDNIENNSGIWTSAIAGSGTDPLNKDTDGDGLFDGVENPDLPYDAGNPTGQPGTDPNLRDSDFDGADDGFEIAEGTDPTSNTSTPQPSASLWSVDMQGIPGVFADNPILMTGSDQNSGIYSGVWNAFDVTGHDGTQTNPTMSIVNARGEDLGITFTVTGIVSSWTNTPGANPIIDDYLFVNAGGADLSATWDISGLSPATEYIFYPYGGVARDMLLTVDTNGNGLLNDETPTSVPGTGFEFTVTSDASGKIIGEIAPGNSGEANWGGWQLASTSDVVIIDTDMDGLSDNAESVAGTDRFNPDTDGDGQNDGAEVRTAKTDPLDPTSFLRVMEILYDGDSVELTWTSVPGIVYLVEGSVDLVNWIELNDDVPATGATTSATVDGPGATPFKAYRVVTGR